jgi:general secretion pathway protein J
VSAGQTNNPTRAERSCESAEAGFTLVELLAAIGLLSLLSVILVGSLHFGLKAWERGKMHADRVDHVALVQNFLRGAIEDAYPFFTVGVSSQGHVEFEGTVDSLRVLSSTSRALATGGRSRLSLIVARDRQRSDLIVVTTPEQTNGTIGTAKKVLLANVQSVELSYFGKVRSEREAAWREQWMQETHLPQLVRVRVSFLPGDSRVWPALVIAPRIGADVGCVYDPLTKQCRGR